MSETWALTIAWFAIVWLFSWFWWRSFMYASRIYTLPAYLLVLWRRRRARESERKRLRDVR